jgi:hypothetical protein
LQFLQALQFAPPLQVASYPKRLQLLVALLFSMADLFAAGYNYLATSQTGKYWLASALVQQTDS